MSENGNNMNNLRYVFVLIGVLALLASYFLVFTKYNTKIKLFPTNIIAFIFNHKEEKLFEIEEYKKENINIDM